MGRTEFVRSVGRPKGSPSTCGANFEENQRRQKLLIRLNLNPSHVLSWRIKYKTFRDNKLRSGFICTISFDDYVRMAAKAKLIDPSQIGLRMDQYQVGRKGDKGDYVKGNCRFITGRQNLEEKFKNGGAARGYAKSAKTLAVQTKENSEGRRSAAKKLSKPFKVISPKGKMFKGTNLLEFCEKKNLSVAMMSRLCRGDSKQVLGGWTGSYTGERGEA